MVGLLRVNLYYHMCTYSNHNGKYFTCTGPLLVQHCKIHVHYSSIGTLYCVFSGITLSPLQRQTIPKAVDALVDKELLEKSIQSIVDKQVSVLVRLS